MKFKDFMDLYDNWNGITVINDDSLNQITKGKTDTVVKENPQLWDVEIVSFSFYDNELCVRLRQSIGDVMFDTTNNTFNPSYNQSNSLLYMK